MSNSHFVSWQAEDGYCGGARPQLTMISADEIEDEMTEKQLRELLESVIQDDFEQKVVASWNDTESANFLAWAREVQAARTRNAE